MYSMTGCGKGTARSEVWEVTVELRSVNHRFLDLSLRLPRSLSFLEETLRQGLSASALRRGHVEVQLQVSRLDGAASQVKLDAPLAAGYLAAARELADSLGLDSSLTLAEVMAMEGVTRVEECALDEEALRALCHQALDAALEAAVAMREREGEHLRADLSAHLDEAAALRERIAERAPLVVEEYRARLGARLASLPIEPVEPQRLAQEVALMADRCAVDEELSRLQSHSAQLRALLDAPGEAGKKLDVLTPEMNREANPIGSKASDAAMARMVVDLKSEIEKIREQVQNVV